MAVSTPSVVVLGSINLDTCLNVKDLPAVGETVVATGRSQGLGGKGANQAAAAARAGAAVCLIGAVGVDDGGLWLVSRMQAFGIDTRDVQVSDDAPSGNATILVDEHGQNSIVIDVGANAMVTPHFVNEHTPLISDAAVLVLQCEIAPESIIEAIRIAALMGTRVVLNLAPYVDLGDAVTKADPLVLNEVEAAQCVGKPLPDLEAIRQAASDLRNRVGSVVITIGAEGAVIADAAGVTHLPALDVNDVVDTTGAGDAFVGVLAAGLADGQPLLTAAESAIRAASMSVQHKGAADGYPSFLEV